MSAVTVVCANPLHRHTTTDDGNGGELSTPVPMTCHFCGKPAHADKSTESFHHDDAPDCWQMGRESGQSACA